MIVSRYIPKPIRLIVFLVYLYSYGIKCTGWVFVKGKLPFIRNRGMAVIGRDTIFEARTNGHAILISEGAELLIGEQVYFNDGLYLEAKVSVKIGNHTRIGPHVCILDSDGHDLTPERLVYEKPVSIGKNVWIGAGVHILAGSSIGDHSMIGAGSIVRGCIPDRCIAAGSPAKIRSTFTAPDDWVRDR